ATQDTSNRGKVYIIYNDGSIPTSAGSADVIITGENTNQYFGSAFTTVDLNNDGREDLVVGASFYSVGTGRVYVFYNDGSIPTTAGTADITITGSNYPYSSDFGISLTTGDFNADGKDDLVVGADDSNANIRGSIHIFYNDGSISTTSATADVIISSENQNSAFGRHLTVGDLNNDGKDDLVVAAPFYSSFTGRSYIYYGGTFSASMEAATSSSVMVTGDSANDDFGFALVAGDMNHDGKDDLIIGAPGYNNGGDTGRVYFYQTREDYAWEIQRSDSSDGLRVDLLAGYEMKITGEPTEGIFASAIAMADLNNDGKEDLIVGAPGYNSGQGGVYIFYNDGNYPTRGGGADVVLTGETSSYFGAVLTTGDLNNDGKDDLAVGAYPDSSFAGRTYIFYGDGSIPTTAATADVIITGESSSGFGYSLTTGDFNADGKDDLVVGAYRYNNYQGRAYIFYGDGSIPTTAATADVIITGETFSRFGYSLATGDFNNDGRVDLAVGAYYYSSNIGRTYIFYGDGSIPTTAATADVTITGEASSRLGNSLATGDFNNDGRDDLVVGATYYSAFPGSTYIFYGDGSIPTTAAAADIILTGEGNGNQYGVTIASGDINNDGTDDILVGATGYNSSQGRLYMYTTNDRHITGEGTDSFFGSSFTSGDYNNDGKTDLAVGAYGWDDNYTGQVYLFYGGSKGTTTASGADVIITGESSSFFSSSLTTGDFNNDGKDDLVVGASAYNTSTGRVYIFYGDGSIPSSASSADISITGQTTNNLFGLALAVVDLNSDGREDLIVGAEGYSSYTGRAYIFYNDGSIPTTAATADIIITGETTSTNFGHAFSIGDFNSDGKDDLAVTASSGNGSVHIFYNDGSIPTTADTADISIVGETTSSFGSALATGDFNNDGKDDLVVGAYTYSTVDFSNAGRTYIFYNDGSIPTTAATADVVITGEDTSSYMGYALAVSDFNADSKDDLAIGAFGYLTSTGRIYVFYGGEIRTRDAVNANLIITGEKINSNTGRNIYSDDLNDNGVDDIIIGAGWYDTSGTNNEGRVYVLMSEASAEHVSTMKINGTVKFNGSVKFH
ncbi:FG-GAP repeat protein, partial [Candidatus Nomurabacteria bacterium]|nr:FG-GAP repeat protein [Candidatus Nomurabacteria bacterium]